MWLWNRDSWCLGDVGNWLLNRPALCCTWSRRSCERPCGVSSLDTAVSKYSYFPFHFKRRGSLSCFSSCTWTSQCEPFLLFLSPDSITSVGPFSRHLTCTRCAAEKRETLVLWHAVCLICGDPRNSSQQSHTSAPGPSFPFHEVLLNTSFLPPKLHILLIPSILLLTHCFFCSQLTSSIPLLFAPTSSIPARSLNFISPNLYPSSSPASPSASVLIFISLLSASFQ